ncbi:L,D-transpeptidase family protein [Methylocystis parvus]|uniref:Murein L,D-transpeptidase n=1 Tax=Methylocystis parvus TaxID=134 RepID=A0A6B8M4U8_9HYPH|nr:murein L,D-transpeptidase family protein [Methylocystis parvus]QGM97365.1 murein L,D-transpeptidase [Methylocystis parvus]WBJ98723.1 murein L,D-transpeptidase [Methylocystis parvus OBBP]
MKPRSTYLLLTAIAIGALALGVAALRHLPAPGRTGGGAAKMAAAQHPAGGSILPGLRRAAQQQAPAPMGAPPTAPAAPAPAAVAPPAAAPTPTPPAQPQPAETAALPAAPAAPDKPAPVPETPPTPEADAGVEGLISFPPVAPVPPPRPADIGPAQAVAPLPPVRPRDLASLETPPEPAAPGAPPPAQPPAAPPQAAQSQAAPSQAAPSSGSSWSFPQWPSAATAPGDAPQAPGASPNYVDAPLPPSRPADLERLAALVPAKAAATDATPPAPAAAPAAAPSGGQQTARLEEPTLRPAPDDAFQAPPPKIGMGDPVFVRIFKQEGQLELWLRKNGRYALYKTFPICKWSGRLGPKIKEADYQSPEGFYSVSAKQLNPHSNYYRAFNVGYPNAFDRQNGRTGGLVMVHGACKSVGCFAMTDRGIEEIYGFVEAALKAGQKDIPVHIFPFRMTEANIARETGGGWLAFVGGGGNQQWAGFWKNLKEGYDHFEQTGQPPVAFACGDHYEFDGGSSACKRVAGW